jgi:hypothetical protein
MKSSYDMNRPGASEVDVALRRRRRRRRRSPFIKGKNFYLNGGKFP